MVLPLDRHLLDEREQRAQKEASHEQTLGNKCDSSKPTSETAPNDCACDHVVEDSGLSVPMSMVPQDVHDQEVREVSRSANCSEGSIHFLQVFEILE